MTTPGELWLREYHDRKPDSQSVLIEAGKVVGDGRASYDVFAELVGTPPRVLDLGCGDGALLATFARQGSAHLAGIDLSAGELALARRRPELASARLEHGRTQELPFGDNAFDAVVSHMTLMLMDDLDRVVAEAVRVLAPGGVFAAAVGAGGGSGAAKVFFDLSKPMFLAVPEEHRAPVRGDRRTRTAEGFDEVLGPLGFEPVAWDEIVVDYTAPPEQVWATCTEMFYPTSTLDDTTLAGLHTAFLDETRDLITDDGVVPAAVGIGIARTRLAG
ncbi:class I SAM-dependent methyltransferase [Amycolatopsis rhabdoformis]|uniref:Class I SAM-dependent methyltransferase n=1 Tax=Amycolatopsis rhabdoformis TaxID=1448059 RepID=A0ABZ1HW72_9PSEU|nr:class I SAM-dependent methyltransferase [Amycolatopsis rhabdoformis]WSE26487.1 class I SAM-dependent methyltransferase [Amycolatopsis rhabdoformis]